MTLSAPSVSVIVALLYLRDPSCLEFQYQTIFASAFVSHDAATFQELSTIKTPFIFYKINQHITLFLGSS